MIFHRLAVTLARTLENTQHDDIVTPNLLTSAYFELQIQKCTGELLLLISSLIKGD